MFCFCGKGGKTPKKQSGNVYSCLCSLSLLKIFIYFYVVSSLRNLCVYKEQHDLMNSLFSMSNYFWIFPTYPPPTFMSLSFLSSSFYFFGPVHICSWVVHWSIGNLLVIKPQRIIILFPIEAIKCQ